MATFNVSFNHTENDREWAGFMRVRAVSFDHAITKARRIMEVCGIHAHRLHCVNAQNDVYAFTGLTGNVYQFDPNDSGDHVRNEVLILKDGVMVGTTDMPISESYDIRYLFENESHLYSLDGRPTNQTA